MSFGNQRFHPGSDASMAINRRTFIRIVGGIEITSATPRQVGQQHISELRRLIGYKT